MILLMLYISMHIFATDGMKSSKENWIDDLKETLQEKNMIADYKPGKFKAINRSVSTLNVDRTSKRKDAISVGTVLDVKEIKNHNDRIRGRLEDESWISIAKLDGTGFLFFERMKLDNDIDCDSYNPEDCDDQYKHLEYSAEDYKSEKYSAEGQLSKRKRKEENIMFCDADVIKKLEKILQWCVQHKKYPSKGKYSTPEEHQYYRFLYWYQNKKLETCKNSRIKNLMKKIREKEQNYKQGKISKCDDGMIQKLDEVLQWCVQHKKYPSQGQSCTLEETHHYKFLYDLYKNKKLETCQNARIKNLMNQIREKEMNYEQVKIRKRDDVNIEKLEKILQWCVQHKKYPSRSQSCSQEERHYFEILRHQNEKLETCTNSRIKNLMKEISEQKIKNMEEIQESKQQNPQLFEEDDKVQVLEPFFTNDLSPEKLQKNTVLIVINVLPNRRLVVTDINDTQTYHVTTSDFPKLKLYLK